MLYVFLMDSLRFFRRHWWPLMAMTLSINVVSETLLLILAERVNEGQFLTGMLIINLVFTSWLWGALMLYVKAALTENFLSIQQALTQALNWLPLIVALNLVTTFAVGAGLILLIVPGIYIFIRLSLALCFLVAHGEPVFESIESSWRHTRGYELSLFGGYALSIGIALLAAQTLSFLMQPNPDLNYSLAQAMISLALTPLTALMFVFVFRIFTDSQETN